jgi:hypothetical protein
MYVRIRKDLANDFEFSTQDEIYKAKYTDNDELEILINGEYRNVESVDFDILDGKFDVLSPDGFSIHPIDVYDTPEDAKLAIAEWIKRYEKQGYYSSVKGRIPLDELESWCKLKFIEN